MQLLGWELRGVSAPQFGGRTPNGVRADGFVPEGIWPPTGGSYNLPAGAGVHGSTVAVVPAPVASADQMGDHLRRVGQEPGFGLPPVGQGVEPPLADTSGSTCTWTGPRSLGPSDPTAVQLRGSTGLASAVPAYRRGIGAWVQPMSGPMAINSPARRGAPVEVGGRRAGVSRLKASQPCMRASVNDRCAA